MTENPTSPEVEQKEPTKEGGAQAASNQSTVENQESQADKPERVFTQEELDKIIAKRLKEAQAKWEKSKDLSEVERLKQENEELRHRVMLSDAFSEFERLASKEGVRNVRGLFKVLQSELKFDKDGKPENLRELLKEAKSEFPEFFATLTPGNADAGKQSPVKDGADMNALIRQKLGFGR